MQICLCDIFWCIHSSINIHNINMYQIAIFIVKKNHTATCLEFKQHLQSIFFIKTIILFPLITSLRYMHRGNGWIADSFNVTPPVSSYLLAFIICDFDYKENMTSNGIRVSLYLIYSDQQERHVS